MLFKDHIKDVGGKNCVNFGAEVSKNSDFMGHDNINSSQRKRCTCSAPPRQSALLPKTSLLFALDEKGFVAPEKILS